MTDATCQPVSLSLSASRKSMSHLSLYYSILVLHVTACHSDDKGDGKTLACDTLVCFRNSIHSGGVKPIFTICAPVKPHLVVPFFLQLHAYVQRVVKMKQFNEDWHRSWSKGVVFGKPLIIIPQIFDLWIKCQIARVDIGCGGVFGEWMSFVYFCSKFLGHCIDLHTVIE